MLVEFGRSEGFSFVLAFTNSESFSRPDLRQGRGTGSHVGAGAVAPGLKRKRFGKITFHYYLIHFLHQETFPLQGRGGTGQAPGPGHGIPCRAWGRGPRAATETLRQDSVSIIFDTCTFPSPGDVSVSGPEQASGPGPGQDPGSRASFAGTNFANLHFSVHPWDK